MRVGSTFSGVGGLDLGLERAGMRVLWQAEADEWCRRVLRWHWPDCEIYDDVRCVNGEVGEIDLLTGGFPCQDLSVAGKRRGLAGERSGLFFEFARIADELRPSWLLVENVVGLLSSANGRDFGVVLSTLANLGYGVSWRVVDARFFGVPQRRRRVFIVGYLGDNGERAVCALGAGGEGDLEAGKCSWQDPSVRASGGARDAGVVTEDKAKCLTTSNQRLTAETETFVVANALDRMAGGPDDNSAQEANHLVAQRSVRRLTPVECERLMSWPDGWTAVDSADTPDGKRYAACGNGVVSNVSEWIGRRIMKIEEEGNVY